ncbi:MAG: arylsulfatase [Symploca sp. SIO2D2]|nr:arylsulfatase [Symploca sp. SIO2D2]
MAMSLTFWMLGMLFLLPTSAALAQETTSPPNILVIMADDVGWFNLSTYNDGMMGYRTPNIDRIAEDGIRFTDAYAENSCTAGRAAFITGQSPVRTGLTKVGLPGADLGLSTKDITLAEILKEQGYATGQFGKNHLGDLDKFLPTNHGFEEFYGNLYHLNAEEEPENPDYPDSPAFFNIFGPRGVIHAYDTRVEGYPQSVAEANVRQTQLVSDRPCTTEGSPAEKTSSYVTQEILQNNPEGIEPEISQVICNTGPLDTNRMPTVDEEFRDAALAFMSKAVNTDNKPFFVWFNSSRMHANTRLKPESKGVTGQGLYADGLVEHDAMVGELLDHLDQLEIADNTIVIYTSDNGAQFYRWPDGGITPFKNEKNTNWEGGFRVPFLVRWPAHWGGDVVSNDIISMLDWLPTLTAATGIPELENIGEQFLNPCLEENPDPVLCDLEANPPIPQTPVYQANGRDFEPLYLDGYNFLPRLDDIAPKSEIVTTEEPAPRHEFFYLTDDGSPSALRFDDWKMLFLEQRAEGYDVWSEPFVSLRAPILVNLRRDPFERAPSAASNYDMWKSAHTFLAAPAQAYVAQFLDTLRNYPPRQVPSSFTIDSLLEDLEKDLENMRLEN